MTEPYEVESDEVAPDFGISPGDLFEDVSIDNIP
jgi:hypothetical protein